MIGFCISLLYAIDIPPVIPDWIQWMWTLSMSGAMLFLLLSIWLCLHASITAQSLVVRLLTQWLRLPVPNSKEISKFALNFFDYEKNSRNLLRLPVFSGRAKRDVSAPLPGKLNSQTRMRKPALVSPVTISAAVMSFRESKICPVISCKRRICIYFAKLLGAGEGTMPTQGFV